VILLTVDPGLDQTGVARWSLKGMRSHLDALTRWETVPSDGFPDRLHDLFRFAAGIEAGAVVIEQPRRGGMYRRSTGREAAVMASMYFQNCASGAMVAGFRSVGVPVVHLMPTTLRKDRKQAMASAYLAQHRMVPGGRRTKWSPDELDAVAVGLQVMSNLALRGEVVALGDRKAA
jgi:hypothetical protein